MQAVGGAFCYALTQAGYRVIGVDISHNALTAAKVAYSDIPFVCYPLDSAWPFGAKSVDAIFCSEVIEHIFGVREMLAEMNRVLKPGGLLMLTTPYHGLLKNLAIVFFRFDSHFANLDGGHIRFFTNGSLARLLVQHKFEPIQWRYIGRIRPFAKSVFVVAKKVGDVW